MSLIDSIENRLERIQTRTFIPIIGVMILGMLLRVYFTPWNLPPQAPDTITYIMEGLSLARGDYQFFSPRFVWPAFLSFFFSFLKFDDYFGYVTVTRIVTGIVSVATVPVLYYVAKQFVEKKWAVLAAALFTIESNLVENSIAGLTEPIFILLGLLSFYYIIQKNERYVPISFIFAGLAFDTRFNGIVLVLLLLFSCAIRIRPRNKLIKTVLIGIAIFVITSFPNFYGIINGNGGTISQAMDFATASSFSESISPHLYDISGTLFGPQKETIGAGFQLNANETDPTLLDIYRNAMIKEILHLFRISVPYLAILVPFGFVVSLKNFDFKMKVLLAAIVISFVVAIPQYTTSAVYRNLFFITPFFCILGAIGIEKLASNIEIKNIFLVLFIAGLLLLSYSFLRERTYVDLESFMEKEAFGKFVASSFHGKFMGDGFDIMNRNLLDVSQAKLSRFSNGNVTMVFSPYTISSKESLLEYTNNEKVDYIIIDVEYDNRYPIFQDIYYNENNYPFLEKVFDSVNAGYKKYQVKIFKITND